MPASNIQIKYAIAYDSQPYLATVETQGKIVAVAMRTPPRRLLLSKIEDLGAVEAIAQDLYLHQPPLPGVSGFSAEAQAFSQVWERITRQSGKMGKQMRIHQIQQVQPIAFAPGYLRLAQQSERDLMLDWYTAFVIEAFGAADSDLERSFAHFFSQNYDLCLAKSSTSFNGLW